MAEGLRRVTTEAKIALVLIAIVAMALLPSCSRPTPSSGDALCESTLAMRKDLARALVQDGAPDSALIAAQRLLSSMQAGCAE